MSLIQKIIDELVSVHPDTLSIDRLPHILDSQNTAVEDAVSELTGSTFPVKREGNILSLSCPLLSLRAINDRLDTHFIAKRGRLFSALESTNQYAKDHLSVLKDGEVILAHEQTAGKGRLGRGWTSPAGKSISMSIVLKPMINSEKISLLTQLAAAALVEALQDVANAEIKWPNDILLDRKKIAGILIETEFSGGQLQGIVLGIGLNTNLEIGEIPDKLQSKATSIKQVTGETVDPNKLLSRFFSSFEKYYSEFLESQSPDPFLTVCRTHSALIGQDYWIIKGTTKRKALIKDIDTSGALVVTYLDDDQKEYITSTDLSIRGDHGYI